MRKFLGIPLLGLAHFACSYVLYFVALGIGMKGFDHPHVLTSSEKIWMSVETVMLLPIADPLQSLTKSMAASITAGPGYGSGVRNVVAVVWFLGPLALNSALWASTIWLAYSRLNLRLGKRPA